MEQLTNKEEEVIQALWNIEQGFVKDILTELPIGNHYNTISTIVRKLEDKGYVSYHAFGKTHQYFPIISKDVYCKQFMNITSEKFFNNSYKNMVSFIIENENISAKELGEILKSIEKKK